MFYKQLVAFHLSSSCEFRQTYRMEPTIEPLQELSWDELLNGSEATCTFNMRKRSQGVGQIGKVVVAYICASRSNHRFILLYNLPI